MSGRMLIGAIVTLMAAVPVPSDATGATSKIKLKSILNGYERPLLVTHHGGRTKMRGPRP